VLTGCEGGVDRWIILFWVYTNFDLIPFIRIFLIYGLIGLENGFFLHKFLSHTFYLNQIIYNILKTLV